MSLTRFFSFSSRMTLMSRCTNCSTVLQCLLLVNTACFFWQSKLKPAISKPFAYMSPLKETVQLLLLIHIKPYY